MGRTWQGLLALLVLTAQSGCNLPARQAEPATAEPQAHLALAPLADALVARANQDRAALGLPELTSSAELTLIAFLRAEDMLARGYLGPSAPGETAVAPQQLMELAGYGGKLGELVGEFQGASTLLVQSAIQGWMASEEHRKLLLDPAFHIAGAGLAQDGDRWTLALVLAERGP